MAFTEAIALLRRWRKRESDCIPAGTGGDYRLFSETGMKAGDWERTFAIGDHAGERPAQPPSARHENVMTCRACGATAVGLAQAPSAERKCNHKFDVLVITTAYESGFGHGRNLDSLPNPYTEGEYEHHAYSMGYEEGERRRRVNGSSGYCNQGAHDLCTNKECMCKCHTVTKEGEP